MDVLVQLDWHPLLLDPSKRRQFKPRKNGRTMVIDKGMGLHAFEDLLNTAADYIDMIKIGFGTAPLYPQAMLQQKIKLAKERNITILPGGTFLEVAISQDAITSYFEMMLHLGFTAIEVSDGTIEVSRALRNELIARGIDANLIVFTEYGKKSMGSTIEVDSLLETISSDVECGAELVTIEGRESGIGVGIYDETGKCKEDELTEVMRYVSNPDQLMWETPLKSQQVDLLQTLGAKTNLGNIAPADIYSLETLRRGLRSDTMAAGK